MKYALLCFALLFACPVQALIIEIDPGPVGEVEHGNIGNPVAISSFTLAANELVLDLVFADMKHIELIPSGPNPFYVIELSTFDLPENVDWMAFLSDETGAEIPGTDFLGTSVTNGNSPTQQNFLSEPLLFHDVHFAIAQGSFAFTPGTYTWKMFAFDAEVFIGEWTVPAPATIVLIGLGVAGIGYRRRKQIKAA